MVVVVVDHDENPEPASIRQRVARKVRAPACVRCMRQKHRPTRTKRALPPAPMKHLEPSPRGRQIRLPLEAAALPWVLPQSGTAAPAGPSIQIGNLLALHRAAKSHDRKAIDQPSVKNDQYRSARRSAHGHHHLSTRPATRHRHHETHHFRLNQQITRVTVILMTTSHDDTEQKR